MTRSLMALQPIDLTVGTATPSPTLSSELASGDDLDLVRRVIKHDRQAFDMLYARYASRLRRYLTRHLGQWDLAEEALNDTMMVLWQHATRFNPAVAPLAAWLYGIARQKARKAWGRLATDARPAVTSEGIDHESPEDVILRREQGDTFANHLAILSPAERTAVTLMVFEGLSCRDIATETGVSLSTVTTRLWRARRRLAARATADEPHVPQQGVPPQSPSPSHDV